ncbi:hypothetical protein H206_06967 [Candidatus Electrothrix aarhusensis]|uniref:Uncharacterized protein n=1 Tax=Candidatus Electrothrix aarhusensis TaxID=1859131 RepID=A0A3S3QLF1_9BACT|nr:hypothetical protein H206_06967 [Candidatus Electrothrix aarhusensis]
MELKVRLPLRSPVHTISILLPYPMIRVFSDTPE